MAYEDLEFMLKKFEVLEDFFSTLYYLPIEKIHKDFQKEKSQFLMIYNAWIEFKIAKDEDVASLARIKNSLTKYQRDLLKLQDEFQSDKKGKTKLEEIYVNFSLEKSYDLMGANPRMSMEELKACYHKKMHSNHPDKLESLGLDEAFIELAQERTHSLNKAWEIIKQNKKTKGDG